MTPAFLIAFVLLAGDPATPPSDVERISWLAGCWRQHSETRTIDEMWLAPAGGTMLGVGRTVKAGRTVDFEQMRIEPRDGTLYYVAKPHDQAEAAFKLEELTDGSVTFANPEHDFPQRIRYKRQADGSLLAQIEGPSPNGMRVIDFPMKKVACPGP